MLTSLSNEVWGLINSKTFQHQFSASQWCGGAIAVILILVAIKRICLLLGLTLAVCHFQFHSFTSTRSLFFLFFFFFCDQDLVFYFQLFTVIFFSHHCGRNGLCSSSVSWKSRIKSALASFLLRVKTLIHCVPTIVISLTLQMIVVNIAMTGLTRDEKRLVDTVRS